MLNFDEYPIKDVLPILLFEQIERRKLFAWILAKLFRVSIYFYITGDENFKCQ